MRLNIIDPTGTVSFVAPCHAAKVLAAACAKDPATLGELLDRAERYDAQLTRYVLDGLAVFDEHNVGGSAAAIRAALSAAEPERAPPFRIVDEVTRESSLEPVQAGLIIYNLPAKRIVQVQNQYANIERRDRGRIRERGEPTSRLYRYELPATWAVVP